MNPKVSIIIPIYNPGELLVKCLDSVVSQSLKEIECICIDDESSDNSLDILNEYAKKDSRFKILTQKHSGAGYARNKGIEKSSGEYIVFLDSDDWIESDMCESLYKRAKQLDVDLILFDSTRHLEDDKTRDLIHFDKNKFNEYSTFDYHDIKDKVLNGPYGVIWCKFYRTAFIKENKIDFPKHIMYNDVEFHIKTMLLAKKMAYFPNIFYHYMRVKHDSLQNSLVSSSKAMVFYDVIKDVKSFLNDLNFMEEFRTEFLTFSFYEFRNKLNSIDNNYKEEYFKIIKEYFLSLNLQVSDFNNLDIEYFIYYLNLINCDTYQEFVEINNYSLENNNISNQNEYLKRKEFLKNIHTLIKVELKDYKHELETLKDDLKMVNEVNHDSFEYLLLKLGLDISELNKYDFNENKSSNNEISNIIRITELLDEIQNLKNTHQQEINQLQQTQEQQNQKHKEEIQNLKNTHQQEINQLQQTQEQQNQKHKEEIQNLKNTHQQEINQLQQTQEQQNQKHKEEIQNLKNTHQQEINQLQQTQEQQNQKHKEEISQLKNTIKTKKLENNNLKATNKSNKYENEFIIKRNNDLNNLLIKKDKRINNLVNENKKLNYIKKELERKLKIMK